VLNSIFSRLILATAFVLVIFFGFIDFAAHQFFSERVASAKQAELKLHGFVLLSAAGIDDDGIFFPEPISEDRFNKKASGLLGVISNNQGQIIWQSDSSLEIALSKQMYYSQIGQGQSEFQETPDYYIYHRAVNWEVGNIQQVIIFSVIEDKTPALAEVNTYRNQLRRWFLAPSIALLVVLMLTLRFGINPLSTLAKSLKRIEQGQDTKLDENYPRELQAVTKNINELILAERQQRDRYQKTLANLAHSIKTPLAVMQNNLDSRSVSSEDDKVIEEQVQRIDEIVQHQLQRAVITKPHTLTEPVPVLQCSNELIKALSKVYSDKNIQFNKSIDHDAFFKGDKRDLMEVLGNLLDNACKACVNTIHIKSYIGNNFLLIEIEDDGPGIPDALKDKVLLRGTRTDTSHPGQGLGLDTVAEIVDSYQGQISIEDSEIGGARFKLQIPLALSHEQ